MNPTNFQGAAELGLAKRIGVIVGSTRPTRICPAVADGLKRALQATRVESARHSTVHYDTIDLAEVDLPFLDEPFIPVFGMYQHDHTRVWSELVSSYHGFFFVFPQYNWGYPAVLKNALDFLHAEWTGKPASFATYGRHGGSQAAAQFQQVLRGLRMHELDNHLEIAISSSDIDDLWQLKDVDALLEPHSADLQLINRQMFEALGLSAQRALPDHRPPPPAI